MTDTLLEPPGGVWTQTQALLVDAYRDLQSRKLFWITLILSVLVALIFAGVGIDEKGLLIFGKRLSIGPFNSILIPRGDFYKYLFSAWAIPIWLGFLANALAIVAVAGIFPELITGGSIDLYLSRPIGRMRLFLTKYAFALLFTALQVFLFCVASFLIIGIRGGVWEFGIFLAVPLVTLFFSYIYCICVLVGIVTRSTLAAILITVLCWGVIFAIHLGDVALAINSAAADLRVVTQRQVVQSDDQIIKSIQSQPEGRRGDPAPFIFQRESARAAVVEYQQSADTIHWWRDFIWDVNVPLPKTNETVSLMSRWLLRPGMLDVVEDRRRDDQAAWQRQRWGPTSRPREDLRAFVNTPEVQQEVQEEFGARRVTYIIGTSLGFEAVVLGLAAWVFCRRDY